MHVDEGHPSLGDTLMSRCMSSGKIVSEDTSFKGTRFTFAICYIIANVLGSDWRKPRAHVTFLHGTRLPG